jgi:uncharacterized protein YndB with AHSA1/START domain
VKEKGELTMATKYATNTTHNVVVTRSFDAPLERVWQAWSESDYVKQWWGPTGFTCPLAEMDFREGGTSLVCMRAPKEYGGGDMYNTWTYQRIVPMEKIEFIQHFTDKDGKKLEPATLGLPPGIPESVRHVITFKTLDDDATEMTVTEYGYANEQVVEVSRMGMEQCLDKMAALFAA